MHFFNVCYKKLLRNSNYNKKNIAILKSYTNSYSDKKFTQRKVILIYEMSPFFSLFLIISEHNFNYRFFNQFFIGKIFK